MSRKRHKILAENGNRLIFHGRKKFHFFLTFLVPMRPIYFLFILLPIFSPQLWAQSAMDTLPLDPAATVVEDFLQNAETEGDFDFNTAFENLEIYRRRPINLNNAAEDQLQELGLLSELQIQNLLQYRQLAGALMTTYELQVIPGFDLATIQRILPYVAVTGSLDDYQVPLSEMLVRGNNQLYLRWANTLEQARGYAPAEPQNPAAGRYLGDANRFYIRFKHTYGNKISFGFTAEKDPGEEFFKGSNKKGFDFYSAHFFARDLNSRIRAIAIGDYSLSLGQGLILYSGFGAGKSSLVTSIKRTSRTLRPYTSVNETNFMRGAAATLGLADHLELTVFGALNRRDANLDGALDTLDNFEEVATFTSLLTSGLHRTPAEIEDRGAIRQITFGSRLAYEPRNFKIGLNILQDQFNRKFLRTPELYNRYYFSGDRLTNASIDYTYINRNWHLFGETAAGSNGAIATLNGLLLGLDRTLDVGFLMRYFPKDYQATNPNPFAETTGARNESGLYSALQFQPSYSWVLQGYFDIWRHPWLRFTADAPSTGEDWLVKLTYRKKRRMEAYVQVRLKTREQNAPANETAIDYLVPVRRFQARLHWNNQIHPAIQLRSRVEWGWFDDSVHPRESGFSAYQDIVFRPLAFPLDFSARIAVFDTESFNVRFYSYENDLLYAFSIPAYYHQGKRWYLHLRYKGIRKLMLEGRISRTFWSNQETFGSGLERIDQPQRTQISAQLRYDF